MKEKAQSVKIILSAQRDDGLREHADYDMMLRPLEITVPHHLQIRFGLNWDDKGLLTCELKSGIQDEINATIDTLQRTAHTYRFFAPTTAMLWDRLSRGYITYKGENLEIQTVTDPFTKPLLLRFTCLRIPTSSSQLIDAIIMIIKHNDKLGIAGKALIDGTPGTPYRDPNIENLKYLSAHAMTGVPSQEGKGDLTSIIIQFISAGLLVAVAKLFMALHLQGKQKQISPTEMH
jgi:hypothetical protein